MSICKDSHICCRSTVLKWLFDDEHPEFVKMHDLARRCRAEGFADEIVELADNIDDTNKFTVQAAKLQIEARKWVAARILGPIYGQRRQVDVNVEEKRRLIINYGDALPPPEANTIEGEAKRLTSEENVGGDGSIH